MQQKTSGIILNQVKYKDTSSIVSVYTRQFGRISYAVRHTNSKKSVVKSALIQPLTLVEMEVAHNPKKEIQEIKEIRISIPFHEIPFNPAKSAIALFISEVLQKMLKHSISDETLYDFIESSVCELDNCQSGVANFHLVFLAGFAKQLGFAPDIFNPNDFDFPYFDMIDGIFLNHQPSHAYFLKNEKARMFNEIMQENYQTLHQITFTRNQRNEMLDCLLDYFKIHFAEFQPIRSVEILHQLWE